MNELEYLIRQLDEQRARIIDDLGTGKAQDHAEYRFVCGVAQGLLRAKNLVIELHERLIDSDD
jgi:hypothetical protein